MSPGADTGHLNEHPSGVRHRIVVQPGATSFDAAPHEDLLTAALRHGIRTPYGCRHGNCGTCRHLLVDGDVRIGSSSPYALTAADHAAGVILLCSAYPSGDLLLGPFDAGLDDDEPTIIPATDGVAVVTAIEPRTAEFVELRLRMETGGTFRAGQYMELAIAGSQLWRSFSIASCPSLLPDLEFLIRPREDGRFSASLEHLRPGDRVDVRGPFGLLSLRDRARPLVMVAAGAGVAPIIGMLRDAVEIDFAQPITFVYGANDPTEVPYLEELDDIGRLLRQFRFVRSGPAPADGPGEVIVGLAHLLAREIDDPTGIDVYVCGSPALCDLTTDLFDAKGLPPGRLRCERFHPGTPPTR